MAVKSHHNKSFSQPSQSFLTASCKYSFWGQGNGLPGNTKHPIFWCLVFGSTDFLDPFPDLFSGTLFWD